MGVPKGYETPPELTETLVRNRELIFPIDPRREGAIFDGFVSNMVADGFALEELTVPTLIASAKDDPLAPYRFAVATAARIPDCKLLTFETGGHFLYGCEDEFRAEVRRLVGRVTV
jgi:pimeloyl-ACP methyl ester carboxylesterase